MIWLRGHLAWDIGRQSNAGRNRAWHFLNVVGWQCIRWPGPSGRQVNNRWMQLLWHLSFAVPECIVSAIEMRYLEEKEKKGGAHWLLVLCVWSSTSDSANRSRAWTFREGASCLFVSLPNMSNITPFRYNIHIAQCQAETCFLDWVHGALKMLYSASK